MRWQRLVKEIISKDLQDSNLYIQIPTKKILKLAQEEIELAKNTNGEIENIKLPIINMYCSKDGDIILYPETEYYDNMPFWKEKQWMITKDSVWIVVGMIQITDVLLLVVKKYINVNCIDIITQKK